MLGKDKPQGAAWGKVALHPKLPAALLQPQAYSLELHPCSYPQEQSPEGSFPSLHPEGGRALGNEECLAPQLGGCVACPSPCPLSSW